MDLYDKLDALVKKAEELDAVGDKFVALDDEKNPVQAHCMEKALLELADELENIADTFTDAEREEIFNALDYDEFVELQKLIDESRDEQ
ncbi:MAG: hypothetical protein IJQ85_00045 [Selenomonadaceae bacterium]|nr:hypothetical protein [Selenomonadaceae bacterium]